MPQFDPPAVPLDLRAGIFSVVRYRRNLTGMDRFEYLPNVRCESIHFREGAVLPTAQFSYILDDTDPATPTPYRFEQLWPMGSSGPYVVKPEDELLVYHLQEGASSPIVVFDGFAQVPQVDMEGGGLRATFTAVGVFVRLWDRPVENARYRDAFDGEAGEDIVTGLPVHFNPEDAGSGNCTPEGFDRNQGDPDAYPVFLDAQAVGVRPWTLPGVIRYLFWQTNPAETWAKNPVAYTGQELDDYLESVIPEGTNGSFFDLSNPDTYTTEPIIVRSVDMTGRAVVEAAVELLGQYGFKLFMNTKPDPDDLLAPINELILFRVDGRDAVAPKTLWLPPHGSAYPVPPPQAANIRLARDRLASFNEVLVQTGLEEVEISVVLAPDFEVDAADATNVSQFDTSKLANADASLRKRYRVFIADEDGAGHWDLDAEDWVFEEALDLSAVFPGDNPSGEATAAYVARRRPGTATLFSKDSAGRPRRAELAISRDYAGESPAIWDRSGTWRSLSDSGWRLLKDRLGIEITAENPENWKLPKTTGDDQAPGDALRVVTSLAAPESAPSPNRRFWLRLTTVIRGDFDAAAFAEKRESSPSRFATRRLIDAREHYKLQKIHRSSAFNAEARDEVSRDDAPKATAHAAALRLAHEGMSVAGSITLPYVSHAIGVGDLIEGLAGRGLSFAEMGGEDAGEGPQYPAVVGFSWTCQLPQTTTLFLSDRRAEGFAADRGDGRFRA